MVNKVDLINDDCSIAMKTMETGSVDTIITDPPYGLSFLGKKWDYDVPTTDIWRGALRVAKPGALLFAFGGTRTFHRMAVRIEDAGWLPIDTIIYMYGSGFPKAHDVGINVDKLVAGASYRGKSATHHTGSSLPTKKPKQMPRYEAISEEGKLWTGWKTALKPGHEQILVFQKPIEGTYANNALVHGVAGFNIDGSRIGDEKISVHNAPVGTFAGGAPDRGSDTNYSYHQGRYPANVILDDVASATLDEISGIPASRFFYQAKPSRKEKDTGLDDSEGKKVNDGRKTVIDNAYQRGDTLRKNTHITVKPVELMRYLCRLSKTPTSGVVLDIFMGSGTTGLAALMEGREFIGIEIDKEYFQIAEKRIMYYAGGELQDDDEEYQILQF